MSALVTEGSAMQNALAFANELAKAELLPKAYQKKPAMVLMAMEIARDLGCSVVAVMQGTYEMSGKIDFYTSFMLAQARRAGVIKSVSYESKGEGDSLVVFARAVLSTGECVEAKATMQEAKAEGWLVRNPKYRSMPEQMLSKRAMKRLISLYCPEVMLGAAAEDAEETQHELAPGSAPAAVAGVVGKLAPASKPPAKLPEPIETTAERNHTEPEDVIPEKNAAAAEPRPLVANGIAEAKVAEVRMALATAGAEAEDLASVRAEGEGVLFDAGNPGHRKIVTEVFNAREIPARWRNLHREKLTAFLSAKTDLRATLEDVGQAVEEYVLANPPGAAK